MLKFLFIATNENFHAGREDLPEKYSGNPKDLIFTVSSTRNLDLQSFRCNEEVSHVISYSSSKLKQLLSNNYICDNKQNFKKGSAYFPIRYNLSLIEIARKTDPAMITKTTHCLHKILWKMFCKICLLLLLFLKNCC